MKRKILTSIITLFLLIALINPIQAKIFQEDDKIYVEQELEQGWNLIAGFNPEELYKNSEIQKEDIISAYFYNKEKKRIFSDIP